MSRYRYLDVLRGFAMLGILPANLPLLALPIFHSAGTKAGIGDTLGAHATLLLVEHKFLTLFCLLFGAGIYLLRQRAESRGEASGRLMLRRLAGIFLFGLLHVVVLWFGDILWYYAMFGGLATCCFRWPLKRKIVVGVGLLCVTPILLALGAFFAPQEDLGPGEEETAAQVALVEAPLGEFIAGIAYPTPEFETALYRDGGYLRQSIYRVGLNVIHAPMMAFFMSTRVLALMLLGMALAQRGWFLDPVAHRKRFRSLAVYGLAAGGLLHLASLSFSRISDARLYEFLGPLSFYLGTLVLAAGYAGVVGVLVASPRWRERLQPVEAVGKTALSNYIVQSAIGGLLFYSYGVGLYGTLDRGQLWLVVIAIWSVLLLASVGWLRRFRRGPLEAVLRHMVYGSRACRSGRRLESGLYISGE